MLYLWEGEGKRLVTRGVREDVGGLVGKMVGEVLTDNNEPQ